MCPQWVSGINLKWALIFLSLCACHWEYHLLSIMQHENYSTIFSLFDFYFPNFLHTHNIQNLPSLFPPCMHTHTYSHYRIYMLCNPLKSPLSSSFEITVKSTPLIPSSFYYIRIHSLNIWTSQYNSRVLGLCT